ncbi:MAG: hypothetical protein DPW15_05835 [Chloroflexi bacterium]|nr:hypothetical protein [Chloroflexota bacterium]
MMFEIASQKPFRSIIYHFSIGNNMQKNCNTFISVSVIGRRGVSKLLPAPSSAPGLPCDARPPTEGFAQGGGFERDLAL